VYGVLYAFIKEDTSIGMSISNAFFGSNEDRHPSENGGRLMVCKDLKSLVHELGSGCSKLA